MKREILTLMALASLSALLLLAGCAPQEEVKADLSAKAEMPPNVKYKVAAVQFEPTILEKDNNVEALLALCSEAADNGAKVIVTPEMSVVGYCFHDRAEIAPLVEPVPGPTTDRFAELAKEKGVYICIGLAEVDPADNVYYNTAALVGPDGYVDKYRKTHSWVCDPLWAADGDLGFKVIGTEYGNLAILICMDCDFIETARVATAMGADVILYPTAYPGIVCPTDNWFSRAFENGVYYIAANRWGIERGAYFGGGSCILNPDGSIQSWKDIDNTVAYGEVDIERVRKRLFADTGENKILDRRPELYQKIIMNTYMMTPGWFFNQYDYDPLPEGTQTVLAAAQFQPTAGDIEANVAAIERLVIEQNSQKKAGLIVFPELAICGVANAGDFAEAVPGPTTDKLVEIAKKHSVYLVVGLPEQDGEAKYNSAVLVGPEGLVGTYRKTHLDHLDKEWASAGDEIKHFNIELGRVGILIGYDALFPETHRCLAAGATDIVAVPSALSFPLPVPIDGSRAQFDDSMGPIPTGPNPNHWHYFRTIGGDNHVYCVFANQYGEGPDQTYMGRSGVFPPEMFAFPRPESIAGDAGDTVVFQDADTTLGVPNPAYGYATNICRTKDYVSWRKPWMYKLLVNPEPFVVQTVNK